MSTRNSPHPAAAATAIPVAKTGRPPRIMVHVVAYNAAATLSRTLDRIPRELRAQLAEICVFDDASSDDTFMLGQGYKLVRDMPMLQVFRNPVNRGYGGNQKLGYRYAIDNGFDFVVLLHGDGQYAPEAMPNILAPLLDGEADAVFGSRMLDPGSARRGGMPLYKYVGNKILTRFENAFLEMNLSEFHSGYRAYSVRALEKIPFELNSDAFHFDTQIIIQLKAGGYRIKEIPIPTFYGDEISHVNGMKYAKDIVKSVIDYRMHQAGVVHKPEYAHAPAMPADRSLSPYSGNRRIVDAVAPNSRVLDIGCQGGHLARALTEKGCEVVGVHSRDDADARATCKRFYVADLDRAAWAPDERDFDYILFADVLEHIRDTSVLSRCRAWLRPEGRIIASTGNVALWYMRMQLLAGRFAYSPRGILDESHVHLYTRDSFRGLIKDAGFTIADEDCSVIPIEKLSAVVPALDQATAMVDALQYQIARWKPELFAYQFVIQATKT